MKPRISRIRKKVQRNLRFSTVTESLIPVFLGSSSSFFPIGFGFAALGFLRLFVAILVMEI